jgi:hypothetical protein
VLIDVGPASAATLAELSDRVSSVSQLTDAAARDLFVAPRACRARASTGRP